MQDLDTFFNDLNLQNIRKLKKVNCKALIILGCNAGHYTHIWNNIAYEFSQKISGITVASDGTVGTAWEGLEDPFLILMMILTKKVISDITYQIKIKTEKI